MIQRVLVSHRKSDKAWFVRAELFSRQCNWDLARDALASADKFRQALHLPNRKRFRRCELSRRPGHRRKLLEPHLRSMAHRLQIRRLHLLLRHGGHHRCWRALSLRQVLSFLPIPSRRDTLSRDTISKPEAVWVVASWAVSQPGWRWVPSNNGQPPNVSNENLGGANLGVKDSNSWYDAAVPILVAVAVATGTTSHGTVGGMLVCIFPGGGRRAAGGGVTGFGLVTDLNSSGGVRLVNLLERALTNFAVGWRRDNWRPGAYVAQTRTATLGGMR